MTNFPHAQWSTATPDEAGIDPDKLAAAKLWLDDSAGERAYRAVIVRDGRVVAEWNRGLDRDEKLKLASACKSIYSCVLGIAVEEGKLPSADAKVIDYYPAFVDVPEGTGPKPGRYAFPKDREITFRQLISNTSGYMKPGEEPGQVFHYQTYGMNVLAHALASLYGLYDIDDPEGSPGLKPLIDRMFGSRIGVSWGRYQHNFDLQPAARLNIFGYYDGVSSNALDMARAGWLWRHGGRWEGEQLIPQAWLQEATRTNPDIRANGPQEDWLYGYGFWTNEHGLLWPDLPKDSFAAQGAGSQHIWVCPSLDLVVAQSPGLYANQTENNEGLLRYVVEAIR